MSYRHLLVHVDSTERCAERVGLAAALAARHGARLTGLHAESDSLGPSLAGRRDPLLVREAAERARAMFDERLRAAGVQGEWWPLGAGSYADVVGLTAVCCRYADLAVFGQHAEPAYTPADLVEQVLLHAGRPVLVVPAVGRHADAGRRVAIGWNASREAARALNDAIPLLKGAAWVGVLAFQQPSGGEAALPMPPVDVAAHLAAHGILAAYERAILGDEEVGAAVQLLNYASDFQADLLVMGAHGLGGLGRGGSARELLATMTVPVLLSC
jgi:nucleotide-binding universal stress UspA family protein